MGNHQMLILLLSVAFFKNSKCTESHLESVQILFRHGDRTPTLPEIPPNGNNPYSSEFEKYGYGQLTKAGKQRMYKFGRMLRGRYGDLIGNCEAGKLYPYSTDLRRAKDSLMLTLAGLCPVTKTTSWNDKIRWFPFPIKHDPEDLNFLMKPYYFGECKEKFWKLLEELEDSEEMEANISAYEVLIGRLRKKSGLGPIRHIYNYLRAIKSMGLKLPEWCSVQDYEELEDVTYILDQAQTSTSWMKKMTAGMLLKRFAQDIQNNDQTKMYLYSAHDLHITALNQTLKFVNIPKIIDYGSALIFEKRRIGDVDILQMFFWASDSGQTIPVKLVGCKQECPLQRYISEVKHLFPSEEDEKCQ